MFRPRAVLKHFLFLFFVLLKISHCPDYQFFSISLRHVSSCVLRINSTGNFKPFTFFFAKHSCEDCTWSTGEKIDCHATGASISQYRIRVTYDISNHVRALSLMFALRLNVFIKSRGAAQTIDFSRFSHFNPVRTSPYRCSISERGFPVRQIFPLGRTAWSVNFVCFFVISSFIHALSSMAEMSA